MLKKLKSLFIIEDEQVSSKKETQDVKESAAPQNSGVAPEVVVKRPDFSSGDVPPGKVDEKFINRLLRAIDDANIDGFDYLEYKQALQNLSDMNMDEQTRFQSTLAMAKTLGASSDSLIKSAEHYVDVLKKEETKFLDAYKNRITRHEDTHTNQLKSLELSISNKKRQVEQLQKEITSAEETLKKKKSEIDGIRKKDEATKDSFFHAYHIVSQQIMDDLEKMRTYLSE